MGRFQPCPGSSRRRDAWASPYSPPLVVPPEPPQPPSQPLPSCWGQGGRHRYLLVLRRHGEAELGPSSGGPQTCTGNGVTW